MRRVLIATEGSPVSAAALRAFARIAGPAPAELHVLAVLPPPRWPGAGDAGPPPHCGAEAAREALDLAIADLAEAGLGARGLLRIGPPAATIVAVATELRCDLIVLGTHDRQGTGHALHRGVAEELRRRAPCAVLTYLAAPQGLDATVRAM